MGRGPQIRPPDDQADPLEMVVEGGAEVIAGRGVAPAQHHVPELFRFGAGLPQIRTIRFGLEERKRTGPPCGFRGVEAQCEGRPRFLALGRKNRIEFAAGSRIDHGLAFMWGAGGGGDVLAAAEAGIEETVGFQPRQGRRVVGEMIRLAAHRFFPIEAEPVEIVVDRVLELRLAARAVDVLEAQQEPAPRFLGCSARRAVAEQGGMGMAEMEKACRAGCESRNNLGEGEGHGGQE